MGERTTGLDDPELLELQIEAIRRNLTGIVRELDHRRHDFVDWRAQLAKRKPAIAMAAGAVVAVAGAAALAGFLLQRRNRTLKVRARNLRKAVGRVLEDPNRLARKESSLFGKVAIALLTAGASALAKSIVTAALPSKADARALPAPSSEDKAEPDRRYEALNP